MRTIVEVLCMDKDARVLGSQPIVTDCRDGKFYPVGPIVVPIVLVGRVSRISVHMPDFGITVPIPMTLDWQTKPKDTFTIEPENGVLVSMTVNQ